MSYCLKYSVDYQDLDIFGRMTHLGGIGTVGLIEQGPNARLHLLPPGYGAFVVVLFEAEFASQFLFGRFFRIQIESIQYGKGFLGVAMLQIVHHKLGLFKNGI